LKKFILLGTLFLILFTGCSLKKVYEPKVVKDDWDSYGDLNSSIVDVASNIAYLEDSSVIVKDKIFNIKLNSNERVLSYYENSVLSSTIDGNLTIRDGKTTKTLELKKTIATASLHNNILAVLFADNEFALYNISTKEPIFKAMSADVVAVDAKIIPPYFFNDLVIFLTLDGKVIIVNSRLKKILRTTLVSTAEYFNNIIYFNIIDNKIIAATNRSIIALSAKENKIDLEARDIKYDGRDIFVFTKQGEVVVLDSNLDIERKIKFPFAHFLATLIYKDNIYILEKEGYLIVLNKDLKNYDVYEVDYDDGYIFVDNKKIYIDDEYIKIRE